MIVHLCTTVNLRAGMTAIDCSCGWGSASYPEHSTAIRAYHEHVSDAKLAEAVDEALVERGGLVDVSAVALRCDEGGQLGAGGLVGALKGGPDVGGDAGVAGDFGDAVGDREGRFVAGAVVADASDQRRESIAGDSGGADELDGDLEGAGAGEGRHGE